ncbi:PAS domain S-box-containing protein [Elusimicrobium posterum]|uniref:response regulator n=1 Tax=Elusimicrobium posterum TaxID=3116653 RepID=UPI003C73BF2C
MTTQQNQPENANTSETENKNLQDNLKNILNGMDAVLYVSDPQTDEILFINDKMRKLFNLKEGEGVGMTCWKVFQKGFTQRCSFCPVPKLLENPSLTIKWEEHNTVTNQYYSNSDSLIDWGGKKAHMQHSIDVTPAKMAEQRLEKRINQQDLVNAILTNFISEQSTQNQVKNALEMTGRFMGLSAINFCKHNPHTEVLEVEEVWAANTQTADSKRATPFKKGTVLYDAFIEKNLPVFAVDEISDTQKEYEAAINLGVKSFIALPVFISKKFWGVVFFDNTVPVKWTEGDKHLARILTGIFSGTIYRTDVEKSLGKMSSLVSATPLCIGCSDSSGNFTYFNPALLKTTGYCAQELNAGGISILHKNPAASRKTKEESIPKILARGSYTYETTFDTKDGRILFMLVTGFVLDKNKKEIGYISSDITKQRTLENELVNAKEAAEKASTTKSDFLARMSHEIRTPINAIIGMTNIGKASKDLDKKDYCLDKVDSASTHLLGIINDILDMSKIEADKFELNQTEFDLENMIEKVVNVANFRLEQKRQNLIINIDNNVPRMVVADEMRLNQVLTNLITNAVKFTPDMGTIRINIKKTEEEGDVITLKMDVQDSGIGISEEQQARLFKSFEQADGSISRKFGGTGLGLAISKRIVELMGGQIAVHSKLGEGSTFTFTVKAHKGHAHKKARLDESISVENLNILAVDDAQEIRDYFKNIMAAFSIKCDTAEDAQEAMQKIEKMKPQGYNIIFVDWMMPGTDGIELTRQIKEAQRENCVVIMISTAQWAEIEEKAKQAGVDNFVGKPLFPSALINVINESLTGAVKHAKEKAAAPAASQRPDFTGKNILIAEDIDINREIMSAFLEDTKVKIDFAFNGKEAVEAFAKDPQKYDLILMDIQMPEMDGYQATRLIRNLDMPRAKEIPIIAMTANVFAEDIQRSLSAGMNDHLGKPVDMNITFEKMQKYMDRDKQKRAAAQSLQQEEEEIKDFSSFLPYIDVADGLSRVLNNKKLYYKLLVSFDGRKLAGQLTAAIREKDFDKIAMEAHTLKGVAANLGLKCISDVAQTVETGAKKNHDMSMLSESINQITVQTLRFIHKLTKN